MVKHLTDTYQRSVFILKSSKFIEIAISAHAIKDVLLVLKKNDSIFESCYNRIYLKILFKKKLQRLYIAVQI